MTTSNGFADLQGPFTGWDESKIAILPVPYDRTSTWIKGADKGPFSIIASSAALELYDIETDSEVYREGIHTLSPLEVDLPPEEMVKRIEKKVAELITAGKFTVVLGGEHSVSIGSAKAHCGRSENVSVLQLDAHADLRDEYEGSRYNHACVMARVKEFAPSVQVGIRSMSVEEKERIEDADVFFAGDIVGGDIWIENAVARLKENVYVTIDLDVFDPSVMPSTGTPEPGGLTWYSVLRLLRKVAEERNVVGFDVVELCPSEENRAPDFLAAKLIYKFLS